MNNTELIEDALEAVARGTRGPFRDLMPEDVAWEWFDLADMSPIIGKVLIKDSLMHSGVDVSPRFTFGVSYVQDRDDDGTVILADLVGHLRPGTTGQQCQTTYYTLAFDMVDRRVTNARGYVQQLD